MFIEVRFASSVQILYYLWGKALILFFLSVFYFLLSFFVSFLLFDDLKRSMRALFLLLNFC